LGRLRLSTGNSPAFDLGRQVVFWGRRRLPSVDASRSHRGAHSEKAKPREATQEGPRAGRARPRDRRKAVLQRRGGHAARPGDGNGSRRELDRRRELEVLRLPRSRALTPPQKQIEESGLFVSPRPRGNHIESQHLRAKIDAKNRVSASLLRAWRHRLLPRTDSSCRH